MNPLSQGKLKNPYEYGAAHPKSIRSVVCHADILGYKQMIEDTGCDDVLYRLHVAWLEVREWLEKDDSINEIGVADYFFKVFSDNLVIGHPLSDYGHRLEFHSIIELMSIIQAIFAKHNFFLRGAVAVGGFYANDYLVGGDAFMEAVQKDKAGQPPRIVLADSARDFMNSEMITYLQGYRDGHFCDLLKDKEDCIFINYLDSAFIGFPDYGGVYRQILVGHRTAVANGITQYSDKPEILKKYEWLCDYHNFICEGFRDGEIRSWVTGDEYLLVASQHERIAVGELQLISSSPNRNIIFTLRE